MNILILNPLCSAYYLSTKFDKLNINCIALFTCDINQIDSYSRVDPEFFNQQVYIPIENQQEIARFFLNNSFDYILNGDECSTHIFDQLTNLYKQEFSNSTTSSDLRMDKYKMQRALRENNLPYISTNQIKLKPCMDFSVLERLNYPIFCKPNQGYGSVGAFLASDYFELNTKFADICSNVNANFDYLIQDLVVGQEFVLDAFSYKGTHYLGNVLQYTKKTYHNNPLYRSADVVHDEVLWNKFSLYLIKMLDTLGDRCNLKYS